MVVEIGMVEEVEIGIEEEIGIEDGDGEAVQDGLEAIGGPGIGDMVAMVVIHGLLIGRIGFPRLEPTGLGLTTMVSDFTIIITFLVPLTVPQLLITHNLKVLKEDSNNHKCHRMSSRA